MMEERKEFLTRLVGQGGQDMLATPDRKGWYVSVKTKDGRCIEDIITQKVCKTIEEAEKYCEQVLNLKKADCTKWSLCECIY